MHEPDQDQQKPLRPSLSSAKRGGERSPNILAQLDGTPTAAPTRRFRSRPALMAFGVLLAGGVAGLSMLDRLSPPESAVPQFAVEAAHRPAPMAAPSVQVTPIQVQLPPSVPVVQAQLVALPPKASARSVRRAAPKAEPVPTDSDVAILEAVVSQTATRNAVHPPH